MDPLQLNRSILNLMGVCADEEDTPMLIRIRNILFYSLMLIMDILNIAACSLYFIKYISTDYDGAIYGLLATTALTCLLYILVTLRFHREEIRKVFSTLQAIHDKCENLQRKSFD